MPDDLSPAGVVSEFDAEAWALDAAADSLAQVIDGFADGDTRPLVIGDGDQPVLVVLAIADLADFRARVAELLASPVDAGWLRYYLRSTFDLSCETLVEQLGVDTDHGLSPLTSQVTVEQAALLLPDHLRRAEAGANPLMLIGDGYLASAALIAFQAFSVLLAIEGEGKTDEPESSAQEADEKPTTPLEVLAANLGPVSCEIVAELNASREGRRSRYELHFEDDLVAHLRDLEARAQAAPGGGAHDELSDMLHSFDRMRSGELQVEEPPQEAPYIEVADLAEALPQLREYFREGADDPYLIGIDGRPLAGLISYDLYELLQRVSADLNGTEEAPVLPLPAPYSDGGPELQPFELAVAVCEAVLVDISAGEGSMLFIADDDGAPELVLAPLGWLWAYVDHLDLADVDG